MAKNPGIEMNYFDELFLDSLPSDPNLALYEICEKFYGFDIVGEQHTEDVALEFYALVSAFSKENDLMLSIPDIYEN